MATLVLSTVGNALGGPVGGAIGALIGQSIDQQLLAPSRRGPRIGDLKIQGSSYGTQIPRMYGTMRVAGSVIWATDLTESSQMSGVKGQPDATYSYSVSMAVALSSRPISSIGRIWADGKLLRGAEGDFKIATEFRFYPGSEDQEVDPLIASAEGLASTPAYRGFALAVFENLELAEFGNRIPFMTFEVVADSEVPNLGAILGDASGEIIACDEVQPVMGYAGYGQSMRAAVEPLIDAYAIDLFDDGDRLVSPGDVAIASISDRELGSSADNQKVSIIQREQTAARTLPAALRIGYYDATLDYQAGEARATAGDGGVEERRELPAVVGAGEAKSLAQHILAREWARRDTLTLHLPPARLDMTPGAIVDVGLSPRLWSVEQCTIDGFVAVAQLKPAWRPQASVSAESGRIAKAEDIAAANLALALFDIPDLVGSSSTTPTLMLAASSASPGWKSCGVEIVVGEQGFPSQTAVRKSVLGSALSILSAGSAHLIDESDALEVQLIDPDQWLVSCDDDALVNGSNLAVLGSELLQFGSAEPLGEGRFRLTRLLRGRGGTEWAMTTHAADEPFALIERDALRAISLPSWSTGGSAAASARNLNGVTSLSAPVVVRGESLRPLSPINVGSAADADGLALTWTRRSRDGWAWIDGVDAPIGETFERYRVTLTGAAGVIETEVGAPALHLSVDEIAALGTGIVSVEVSQVGDLGASRAAEHSFII